MTMQTASMERSRRPSTPLKRYMLPETSTTRRRRFGFCWGLPGWQRNTAEKKSKTIERRKLNISKDKTSQKENTMHFAKQESFIRYRLFFKKECKYFQFFANCFRPVTSETPCFILSSHLQWLETKYLEKFHAWSSGKYFFGLSFASQHFISAKRLKFALFWQGS